MAKKILIVFIICIIITAIFYEKIIGVIDDYAYEHQESAWAPKVEYTIGNFYYVIRKYDRAIEIYRWLLVFYKNKEFELRSDVKYMLGRCYEKKGNISKAESLYREVIGRYPGSDAAKEARRRFMENTDLELF